MLRNMKNVANASHAFNTQSVTNMSRTFPLFSFFAIETYAVLVFFVSPVWGNKNMKIENMGNELNI